MNEREFLKRLLPTFKLEARELLDAMDAGLTRLESTPMDADTIENLFRDAHSLKGAARSVNLAEIARHCHRLEDIIAAWKGGRLSPSPRLIGTLHRTIDGLQRAVNDLDPESGASSYDASEALRALDFALTDAPEETSPPVRETPPASDSLAPRGDGAGRLSRAETVRISAERMDDILLQTEELIGVKLAATQRAAELSQLGTLVREWTRDLLPGEGASEVTSATLTQKFATLARDADRDQRAFAALLDGLLGELKQALMLPAGALLDGLPRIVRELARDEGKDVELNLEGEQIEVDRRVLEELRSPLTHIVRNCVGHGIEPPAQRIRSGKPTRGRIVVRATQLETKHLELSIRDDGRGFDTAALREAALRAGAVTEEEAGRVTEPATLAFQSGVSTSPILTDVSGRGLGLAIVRNKVERLGGAVTLSEPPGGGAEITLRVPITLATFRGVLVSCAGHALLLPTHSVRRVLRVQPGAMERAEGKTLLRVNGELFGLAHLAPLLQLPESRNPAGEEKPPCALIVESANRRLALLVDEIVGEQEVLVKGLGKQLPRVRHIAGAALLGNGALVPILHMPDIVHTAIYRADGAAPTAVAPPAEKRARNILLAEDSITARTLLKSILETAGYRVFPAVDGAEAWATIRTNPIDLVVSDVEMPRMNGFELTARIRSERRLATIPVILVTALESREDRERGIEAGANAYIVKSSFDQSNLFETMQQLI